MSTREPAPVRVPEPRAPGRGRFLWWEWAAPLALGVVLAVAAVPSRQSAVGAFLMVFGTLGAAFVLGRAVGRRAPQSTFGCALRRGAIGAELFTVSLGVAVGLMSPDDWGDLSVASFAYATVFAHLVCLPPLLVASGLGVLLGGSPRRAAP